MLPNEIKELENQNAALRKALYDLSKKMEDNAVLKPKSCQYCKNYLQHYIKGGVAHTLPYVPIYAGHCVCEVPISKGRKRKPAPDDTCPYFEIGTRETKLL